MGTTVTWYDDLKRMGLDDELCSELDKIEKALRAEKNTTDHVRYMNYTVNQWEQKKLFESKTTAEAYSDAYFARKRAKEQAAAERRKLKRVADVTGYDNFRKLTIRFWNKHSSTKMQRIYKPTPTDYACIGQIWTYVDKDIKRGLQLIFRGIQGLKESFYHNKATVITFSQACAKNKLINYALQQEAVTLQHTKVFDIASSGDELALDDNVAVYRQEAIVKILENHGNKCMVAFTCEYMSLVNTSDLQPVDSIRWYEYADEELFKDTVGYQRLRTLS